MDDQRCSIDEFKIALDIPLRLRNTPKSWYVVWTPFSASFSALPSAIPGTCLMSSVTGEASHVAKEDALMCVLLGLNSAGILPDKYPLAVSID
jgi:hypothetical protein